MNAGAGTGPAPAVANVGEQVNGVAPNRAQYVQFNEAMDPSTINSQTIVVKNSGGTAIPGTVSYNSTFDVAGFQPNPALQDNSTYSMTVTTGVASAQGAHLAADYSYNFTTRPDTDKSPIYVKAVTPAANASCVTAGTPITITFSEGAEVSTLTPANIAITGPGNAAIPAQMSYNIGTGVLTLTPSAALPTGAITVTVSNVADAAGVAMTKPFSWSFSTACNTGGGGGGGTGTTQYTAPLESSTSVQGQVTIDTAGNTNITFSGATPNSSYSVQFCPASNPSGGGNPVACFDVATVLTSSNGKANTTAKFPKSGNWAGDFQINDAAGKPAYSTYLAYGLSNQTYMSTLLQETKTNNGALTQGTTQQDPLTSGTISYSSGGQVKVIVKGASTNTQYQTIESETTYLDGSGSYELGSFTTDGSGNGSSSAPLNNPGGDIFDVISQDNGAGFIGGFSIP